MSENTIQFVSLGPGDPELITLKALHRLQASDVIFCASTGKSADTERSRSAELLAAHQLDDRIRRFRLPMSKQRDAALAVYRQLYSDAREAYMSGQRVAVAVEGDAGVYASMHYVLELLEQDHIPVEQHCGIPSFIAAGGIAHLHLMQQEQRLLVAPGNMTADELDGFLRQNYSIVLMKLSQCEAEVKSYMRAHSERRYHYFENVATPEAFYLNEPEAILARPFPYFSLLVIQ